MTNRKDNRERGKRLQQAMNLRGRHKMMALAVEIGVSPAALSKWKQGGSMSIEHACRIAQLLDVSLDWLLMGRRIPDWLPAGHSGDPELELIELLRDRPAHLIPHLIEILSAIPKSHV